MSTKLESDHIEKRAIEAVQRVLKERLDSLGFRKAQVYSGRDHDGDPVLFIDVRYNLIDKPIDTNATFGLLRALREALEEVGETRFPHVRHHFDNKQRVRNRQQVRP